MTTLMAPTNPQLAGWLQREIDQRGWSRRYAAERFGMESASTLDKIINNPERVPDLRTLNLIAKGLQEPLTRLIELCGFPIDDDSEPPEMLGLTAQERRAWKRLSPRKRAALLAAIEAMLDDEVC